MVSNHKPAIERAPGGDAIELLIADHRRVAKLFAEFHALKDVGSDEAKAAVVAQICQELTVHTAIEEEIFYPEVRKAIEDDDLMDEALVEHAGAKALIAQLRSADPDDDLYDARVKVLSEEIDHHVEEEEGNMFAQAKGSAIDTMSLGAALLKRKAELLGNPDSLPPMTKDSSGQGHGQRGYFSEEPAKPERVAKSPKKGRSPEAKKRSAVKKTVNKTR
jgi:hemerythrin superfamily protein